MDWQSQHFTQEAVFSASPESILAAARAVVAESLGRVEDTPDGFVAHGRSGGHAATATFRIQQAQDGTKVTVELLVARAGGRGFMLFDVGGYYDIQLRRWLSGISRRLGQPPISRSQPPIQQGCLAGCVVYLLVGTGLAILAIPLDRWVFLQPSSPLPGPAMLMASSIGFLAGVVVFLYVRYPEASIWSGVRERLQGLPSKERP
jgi:hypothetical protein